MKQQRMEITTELSSSPYPSSSSTYSSPSKQSNLLLQLHHTSTHVADSAARLQEHQEVLTGKEVEEEEEARNDKDSIVSITNNISNNSIIVHPKQLLFSVAKNNNHSTATAAAGLGGSDKRRTVPTLNAFLCACLAMVAVVLTTVCAVYSYYVLRQFNSTSSSSQNRFRQQQFALEHSRIEQQQQLQLSGGNGNKVAGVQAIAIVSAKKYVDTTMVDDLLSSLNGKTSLPVYVLTDLPGCVDQSKYTTGPLEVIKIYPEEGPECRDMAKLTAMNIKMYKTKLFEHVSPEIDNILYLDRDIRLTESFRTWKAPTLDQISYENCNIIFAKERAGLKNAVNAGTFVVHRNISEPCLSNWGENIASMKYLLDQPALGASPQCKICAFNEGDIFFTKSVSNYLRMGKIQAPIVHYTSSSHTLKEELDENCDKYMSGGAYNSLFWFNDQSCWNKFMGARKSYMLNFEMKECAAEKEEEEKKEVVKDVEKDVEKEDV